MIPTATPAVPPGKLARRTRVLAFFFAPVFAVVGIAFTGFGLAAPAMLVAGVTEIVLSALLMVAVFVASPIVRWIALGVAVVGAATAAVMTVTALPEHLGLAATYLLGVFAMLGLTWFIVHSSARSAHPAQA